MTMSEINRQMSTLVSNIANNQDAASLELGSALNLISRVTLTEEWMVRDAIYGLGIIALRNSYKAIRASKDATWQSEHYRARILHLIESFAKWLSAQRVREARAQQERDAERAYAMGYED